jgi:cell division protein FtsN
MLKDYSKKFQKSPTHPRDWMIWLLVILGLVIIAAGVGLWHMEKKKSAQIGLEETAKKQETPPPTKLNFEFYTMLPKENVKPVPEPVPAPVATPEALKPMTPKAPELRTTPQPTVTTTAPKPNIPKSTEHYILQLAVFTDRKAAENYKNQLGQIGAPVLIVADQSKPKTVYRVQAGPFADQIKAKELQAKLAKSKINSLLRKA